MAKKLFTLAAPALAAAALLLGACKANDTAGGSSASQAAGKNAAAGQTTPAAPQASPATGTTTVHADGVRRVTPAELKQMVDAGTVAIYDTRTKGAYDAEHIKGALSMPPEEVEKRVAEFPRDKTLVFYCT